MADGTVLPWLRVLSRCPTGREVQGASILGNTLIGLYFSASWSPPCRSFTPILMEAYQTIREQHGTRSFEVVLVPLDTSEDEWRQYTARMPWLTVPLSCREAIIRLFFQFNVSEAPRLVLLNGTGDVVCLNARGGKGFGFGCDPLKAYDRFVILASRPGEAHELSS
mmetsp:Transcript_65233/g.142075  ORF Transcript_65233/g.142075 Transcript_65233/m.142075 type:complete len:166 (-) Transcript_65233:134-631(-)